VISVKCHFNKKKIQLSDAANIIVSFSKKRGSNDKINPFKRPIWDLGCKTERLEN
jgi:hypothetical protein